MGAATWIVGGLLLLVVVAILVAVVRPGGLRQRFVLALLAAALLPSLIVSAVLFENTREVLSVLRAPGLREAADGGLGLARAWLEREQDAVAARAVALDLALREGTERQPVRPGDLWMRVDADDARVDGRGDPAVVRQWWKRAGGDAAPAVTLVRDAESDSTGALVAVRRDAAGALVFVRPLPVARALDLRRVEDGSRGIRQLDLVLRPALANGLLAVVLVTVLVVTTVAALAGPIVGRRLVRPLVDLVDASKRVAAGDLEHRVETRAVGEVADLVDAFNGMTAQLAESERRLRQTERLAAWQGIARRLAHEIKNPLTPVQLAVHRLDRRVDDPASKESLRAIEDEVKNLQRLADEFSALGRLPEPRLADVDLVDVWEGVTGLYVPEGFDVGYEGPSSVHVVADAGQLRQVLSNLVKNAVEAMGETGRLRASVHRLDDAVRLHIDDDGPGLGDEPERVFEAGYTTRSTGTGLGLAIVQRIVEDHGGRIEAGRSDLGGTSVILTWPAADRERT